MRYLVSTVCLTLLLFSCGMQRPLQKALKKQPLLHEVALNKDQYRLQIIYTPIEKDKKGKIYTKDYKFNIDTSMYFYPASTAKLLVSAFALEKLTQETQGELSIATPLKAFAIGPCQTDETYDSSAENFAPSIGHYIHKMLLVSDNSAYNRVFDFLGQDYPQQRLKALGFDNARIIQRFDPACNADANRYHNRFEFYNPDSSFLLSHTAVTSAVYFNPLKNVGVGNAYYIGDSLAKSPKQFRFNNNLPLETLHQSLMRIIFPTLFPENLQFQLQQKDYGFLKRLLGQYPSESEYPKYDSSYFQAYKKYLYYGKEKNAVINHSLRIYNIVGQAYGFTTDVAYFEDSANAVSFFLSATIYTNADETLNDDKYEYETIAFPFMKTLGQEIYTQELKRKHRSKHFHSTTANVD